MPTPGPLGPAGTEASGWFGAFVSCPLCGTAVPPGRERCPACNFAVGPPPRPKRSTLVRLGAYAVGVWVAALLLVLAFR